MRVRSSVGLFIHIVTIVSGAITGPPSVTLEISSMSAHSFTGTPLVTVLHFSLD
jgi:hypothetical protein